MNKSMLQKIMILNQFWILKTPPKLVFWEWHFLTKSSFFRHSLSCFENVSILDHFWMTFGTLLEHIWLLLGSFLECFCVCFWAFLVAVFNSIFDLYFRKVLSDSYRFLKSFELKDLEWFGGLRGMPRRRSSSVLPIADDFWGARTLNAAPLRFRL